MIFRFFLITDKDLSIIMFLIVSGQSIIGTGEPIMSTGVVLVVLVLVFVVPGVVFLVLVAVVACHCSYYH